MTCSQLVKIILTIFKQAKCMHDRKSYYDDEVVIDVLCEGKAKKIIKCM